MTINKIIGSLKINWRTYKNAEYQSILKIDNIYNNSELNIKTMYRILYFNK